MGGKTISAREHEVDRWRYIYTLAGTPEVMDEPFTLFAARHWVNLIDVLIPGFSALDTSGPERDLKRRAFGVKVTENIQDIIVKDAIRDGHLLVGETDSENVARLMADKSLSPSQADWAENYITLAILHPPGIEEWEPPSGEVLLLDFRTDEKLIQTLVRHRLIEIEKVAPMEARIKEPAHKDR